MANYQTSLVSLVQKMQSQDESGKDFETLVDICILVQILFLSDVKVLY